ncbi:MAG: PDZ domain-containing protein [Planctomycetaceae bacterium]|nr:PDZ domain-containing protein [Planctomycetaceae bacterium]
MSVQSIQVVPFSSGPGAPPQFTADPVEILSELETRIAVGAHSALGVVVNGLPEGVGSHLGFGNQEGVIVAKVLDGGPAAKAGIQQFDILLKLGDQTFGTPKDLQKAVQAAASKPVSITLMRAGKQQTVEVTPAPISDFQELNAEALLAAVQGLNITPVEGAEGVTLMFGAPGAGNPFGIVPQTTDLTAIQERLTNMEAQLKEIKDLLQKQAK